MASEEDRAKIMAKYYQNLDEDDDDDEEEFQEGDDEDDDDDEGHHPNASDSYDHEDDDDEDNPDKASTQSNEHYAILNGHLTLNDEKRLVYSGTWCMKKDLALQDSLDDAEKKKTKFKLKSKQVWGMNGKFDLLNPLSSSSSSGKKQKKTRIVFMDGFFTTDKTDTIEPHRKIKEQDVEIIFSQGVPMKRDALKKKGDQKGEQEEESSSCSQACFVINGRGSNDFGNFTLEGIYCPDAKDQNCQELKCSKRYAFAGATKRGREYDSEDDYVISDDEAAVADVEELMGLADDAALSVEALRRKYYGDGEGGEESNGTDDEEMDRKMPAKRYKTAEEEDDDSYGRGRGRGDEDDDDGCGF